MKIHFNFAILHYFRIPIKIIERRLLQKLLMNQKQTPEQNQSILSTINHTHYQTSRINASNPESRPKTANLLYANKPYVKQTANWNQSASTWRHSSRKTSFSKSKRFITVSPYSLDIIEPDIKAQISQRATSFGKGRRTPIPQRILRNAKQKPAPDAYKMNTIDEMTRQPSKGKTIGSGWDKYQKYYVYHRKDVYSSHFVKQNPSAKYDVRQKPGKQKRAFSAYPRQKMFTQKMSDLMRDVPGPKYLPEDRKLYSMVGMQNRSFTSGQRLDLSAPANFNPGSQYNIAGFCDKFKYTRQKRCPC